MNKKVEVILTPEEAFDETRFRSALREKAGAINPHYSLRPLKRSVDARGRKVLVRILVEVIEGPVRKQEFTRSYPSARGRPEVVVVGAGPAGLFAALRLLELGYRPLVVERGKNVRARRRDLAAINKDHIVNPESNYCFGEGGAGTYSDGKLYTRSKKRGDLGRILETMVAHGASEEILFDSHPHIGTNKLPLLVTALRESIEGAGGEVIFNSRVTDFIIDGGEMKGVVLHDRSRITGRAVILATGHSARDIFQLLQHRNILIEPKSFAVGIRVEHDQNLIDRIQYHCESSRGDFLPASSYSVVHQARSMGRQRGVFSFCMCPGGFIVPSATAPGEVVVNGMSPSRRDSKHANSGIVAAVDPADFSHLSQFGDLAGMHFQADIEQRACQMAGHTQAAPAQRLMDFLEGRASSTLGDSSYQPGLVASELSDLLPGFISECLKQGLRAFGKKMRGFLTNEAHLIGVESRTSSPVRILRREDTLEHVRVRRLFPAGEGAGFAGGIVSAAMDGERCAEAVARLYPPGP